MISSLSPLSLDAGLWLQQFNWGSFNRSPVRAQFQLRWRKECRDPVQRTQLLRKFSQWDSELLESVNTKVFYLAAGSRMCVWVCVCMCVRVCLKNLWINHIVLYGKFGLVWHGSSRSFICLEGPALGHSPSVCNSHIHSVNLGKTRTKLFSPLHSWNRLTGRSGEGWIAEQKLLSSWCQVYWGWSPSNSLCVDDAGRTLLTQTWSITETFSVSQVRIRVTEWCMNLERSFKPESPQILCLTVGGLFIH